MAVYSIKELENLSGIKAHTIRIWEKRYNLIEPYRTTTNIRYYSDVELKKILNVAMLNRHGIKISNIAKLTDQELTEEILRVSTRNPGVEGSVDSLIAAMIEMDEIKFNNIMNILVSRIGMKDTVLNTLYPFLEKVGILWQAGVVNPAQEHFVSNLIRQKIISGTDAISTSYSPDAKVFLLFLPEGEWHEIGLLFSFYLIKEAGHDVIYLGQSVPYSDVLAAGSTRKFDYVLLSSTIPYQGFDFKSYMQDLGGAFPDKHMLYFSKYIDKNNLPEGQNFQFLKSIEDLTAFIESV